ncbi:(d)CMP kinase [Microlunatus kandeliicorticis]|uniref:(d)CMP kinase n=1 Tax=Microlunatus kandeliicorticis TaxID=1759536 RepID=UPI0015F97D96|nr:(d)CMP kinase [Microlunatus kandeliicorticis]
MSARSASLWGVSGSGERLVVAIDGPSGSGKSSTARGVAERLGLDYLDTGAMYRAATWLALHEQVDRTDRHRVSELVARARFGIDLDPRTATIAVDGVDVTTAIREPAVSAAVSSVATNLEVRHDLVARQQALIADSSRGIVVEGRDITTVVAPDAQVRVLLVADPAARVARRRAELGETVTADDVTDQVIRRDADDSTVAAFTEAAPGVTVVDSTHAGLDEVIGRICTLAEPYAPSAT